MRVLATAAGSFSLAVFAANCIPLLEGALLPLSCVLAALCAAALLCLRPQKDALCGVVGDLLPAEGPLCQGAVGHRLHPVPWPQVRPLFVRIDQRGHRGPRLPVRPDQH